MTTPNRFSDPYSVTTQAGMCEPDSFTGCFNRKATVQVCPITGATSDLKSHRQHFVIQGRYTTFVERVRLLLGVIAVGVLRYLVWDQAASEQFWAACFVLPLSLSMFLGLTLPRTAVELQLNRHIAATTRRAEAFRLVLGLPYVVVSGLLVTAILSPVDNPVLRPFFVLVLIVEVAGPYVCDVHAKHARNSAYCLQATVNDANCCLTPVSKEFAENCQRPSV